MQVPKKGRSVEMAWRTKLVVVVATVGTVLAVTPMAMASATSRTETAGQPSPVEVPAGMTAGIAVYDRVTQRFTERTNGDRRFRSASLVKLLIAADLLWELGPDYTLPAADQEQLEVMLRSSDDAAASAFWARNGRGAIVERMITRLHLEDSAPPPPEHSGWGSTVLSADDVVRIYRYVLEQAPSEVRQLIMGNLHRSTECGTDRFDQTFGIPDAFVGTHAVKQGWVNFGEAPRVPCGQPVHATNAARTAGASITPDADEVNYGSGALHTSGTVGKNDRVIVVVLSLHAIGTSFQRAAYDLTRLTRSLRVPGAVRAPAQPAPPASDGLWFGTWSSNVAVHAQPTTTSAQVGTVPSGIEVLVDCQAEGEEVVSGSNRNNLWTYLPEFGGYMSNIFFEYPDNRLPVVPDC
jgi:hypothetical protein